MRVLPLLFGFLLAIPAFAQTHTFASGLALTLPEDWTGDEAVDESQLPRSASYRFENTNAESRLRGTVLHIERLTGLNPVMQERFSQGRVPFGYHGARPVAALGSVPYTGAVGFQTEQPGRTGVVYFVTQGSVYWTVQIEAPAAVFAAQQEALLDLARTVRFPTGS
ncbi:MAG: hypothetical protein HKN04_08140 [Rhodothermaceae bacterium]|nr:hypothetical protein [Rhodothermaceae bacterium]